MKQSRRDFLRGWGSSMIGAICAFPAVQRIQETDKDAKIAELERQITDYSILFESLLADIDWYDSRCQELESENQFLRLHSWVRDNGPEVLPPLRPLWPPEPATSTPINVQFEKEQDTGRVFFVNSDPIAWWPLNERSGLSPDEALPSIAEALKRCDCGPLEIVVQYGQCDQGEQT